MRRLKTAIITAPIPQLFEFDREFTVTIDAAESQSVQFCSRTLVEGCNRFVMTFRSLSLLNSDTLLNVDTLLMNGSYWELYGQWENGGII